MNRAIRTSTRRRGFLMMDAIFGILILGVCMVMLVVTVSRESTAEVRLADARRATAIAEATLTNLQCGSPLQSSADAKVSIEPCKDGRQVNGMRWARVTVRVNNETRSLIGLVPWRTVPGPTTREVSR
ncbi:MAG TPA: hypothetical protein VN541_22160 [Tepidisphaeraceae bacterium]|nr:hypothetical protein [Tepidisphaeraceae bacterium]